MNNKTKKQTKTKIKKAYPSQPGTDSRATRLVGGASVGASVGTSVGTSIGTSIGTSVGTRVDVTTLKYKRTKSL